MRYTKKLGITLIFSLLLTCAIMPNPVHAAGKFKDMEGHWAKDIVYRLVNDGVINGYKDGTYRPDEEVSRAEFIKMCVTASKGYKEGLYAPDDEKLEDWAKNHWFSEYTAYAANKWDHATNEYGDAYINNSTLAIKMNSTDETKLPLVNKQWPRAVYSNLNPSKTTMPIARSYAPIIRREAAYVITDVLVFEERKSYSGAYPDENSNSDIEEYDNLVQTAYAFGIVGGYPDGEYKGENTLTRAEAATIVGRLIYPELRLEDTSRYDEEIATIKRDEEYRAKRTARAQKAISESITEGMSEYEKAEALAGWLAAYADNNLNICQWYAENFCDLCEIAGIEYQCIGGRATNSLGEEDPHAWNRVKCDGEWYWIDVTWMDAGNTKQLYDKYNLTKELWSDHTFEEVMDYDSIN